jgi:hypothetical protein
MTDLALIKARKRALAQAAKGRPRSLRRRMALQAGEDHRVFTGYSMVRAQIAHFKAKAARRVSCRS